MAQDKVTLVDIQVQVPKELAEVKDLLVGVAKDLIAGKKPTEIAFESLPKLQEAVEGIGQVASEIRSPQVYTLGALLLADVAAIYFAAKAAKATAKAAAALVAPAAEAAAPEAAPQV